MSKNPYKPINAENSMADNLSDSAKEFLKEVYSKDEMLSKNDGGESFGVVPIDPDAESNFQPQLSEKPDNRPIIAVNVKEDEIAYTQQKCAKLFSAIFLEMINSEKALAETSGEIQKALMNQGIEVNIDSLASIMDMANERMLKILMAKSMAHFYGMNREWDQILPKELDLIYSPRRSPLPDQQK